MIALAGIGKAVFGQACRMLLYLAGVLVLIPGQHIQARSIGQLERL